MIIVAIVITSILSFIFYIYINNKTVSNILTIISVIALLISVFFMVKNDHDHYGLQNVTTSSTQKIYSSSPSKQLLLMIYQSIGTADKHQVYIYKTSADAKKNSHTRAEVTTTNVIKRTTGANRIVTAKIYREYKNSAYKFWFSLAGNGHKYVKETNTIYINKDWTILSAMQVRKLQNTC